MPEASNLSGHFELVNMDFEKRLKDALRSLELSVSVMVGPIVAAYRGPYRFFHNLDHIEACLILADEFEHDDPRITLALCYHDVVHDTRSSNNEKLSADWALHDLRNAGAKEADSSTVARLILATNHRALPKGADEMIVADVDLSVLGSASDDYARYARAIRREYFWMPNDDYRAGRIGFLRHMLGRSYIYSTEMMRERFETRARENIKSELIGLRLRRL